MGYTCDLPSNSNSPEKPGKKLFNRAPKTSNREYWDMLEPEIATSLKKPKTQYPGDNKAQRLMFALGAKRDNCGSIIEESPRDTRVRGLGVLALISTALIAGGVLSMSAEDSSKSTTEPIIDSVACTVDNLNTNQKEIPGFEINMTEALHEANTCMMSLEYIGPDDVYDTASEALTIVTNLP